MSWYNTLSNLSSIKEMSKQIAGSGFDWVFTGSGMNLFNVFFKYSKYVFTLTCLRCSEVFLVAVLLEELFC